MQSRTLEIPCGTAHVRRNIGHHPPFCGSDFSPQLHLLATNGRAGAGVRFTDVRKSAGIAFRQDATATNEKYYLETMGTGVGWIDFDDDGLPDIYFVQSAATDIYTPPQPLRSALYHNNGDGTFTDVTTRRVWEARATTARESPPEISTMTDTQTFM